MQSIISYGSDTITIIFISHFMGLRAMIVYSHVWYIAEICHMVLSAWYEGIYKHVNYACSLETIDGYHSAGHLTKVGMIGITMLSIPCGIITVVFMPFMMGLLGYDGAIVVAAQQYAIVVVFNYFISSIGSILYCILDLEGYAKFAAIYEFWESVLCITATFIFITVSSPSLFAVGIFHLFFDTISTVFYFYIVYKKGDLDGYIGGFLSSGEGSSWVSWTRMANAAFNSIAHTHSHLFKFIVYTANEIGGECNTSTIGR